MNAPPQSAAQAPYSQEAEEAVLGAVLINPDSYLNIASFLKTEDFFILRHQYVWEALTRISERNERPDFVTLQDELRAIGRLNEIGGPAYILSLINNTPSSIHAEVYARLVERASTRRRLMRAADEIKGLALDENLALERVVSDSESKLFGVTEATVRRDIQPIGIALNEYFERVESLIQSPEQMQGLPTGFRDLDFLLGGLQRSDLLIFAGRPGMGKTSFLLSVALNAAKVGARIAIFTMEMGAEQIVQRFVAMETGINSQKLRTGQLTPPEYSKFVQSAGVLGDLPIFIDDTPSMTPVQMRTKCRRVQHEYGLDLVIVDYLQLMSGGGTFENNRVQEISYISRSLKEMARELNVPVFSAAQLSRAVEQRQDKHPQLSDLRESGCLAGESLVYLPDTGEYVPIRDLQGRSGFRVVSLNTDTWKLEPAEVTRAWCTGRKPVFKLTTQLGRTIRATGNHKFLTVEGWKRLDELTADDCLALPRSLPSPQTQTMSHAELALLGHLIGDGCTLPKHAIQYTTREEDIAHTVIDLATQVFGNRVDPRIYREPGRNWYQVFIPSTQHLTHAVHSPVRVWLDDLGVFGLRSCEKRIPAKVFQQPAAAIAAFLRHLWATDGHIGLKKTTKGPYPNIFYATSSSELASGVQSLLLRLGINARRTCVPQTGKGRDQFHVIPSGQDDFRRFIEQIGAVGERRCAALNLICAYLETHPANTNRDVIPHQIWRTIVVPAMATHEITSRQMQANLGNAYCGTALYKQNISRDRGSRLAQVLESDPIARLAQSDVYWDAIASIEPDGECEVFDLTVPQNNCFVVNDLIAHNSLEQDADIVMFLYREVVYNEAADPPNQAEVIVSKHRNGPTDTVQMIYERTLTKFLDVRTQKIDLSGL